MTEVVQGNFGPVTVPGTEHVQTAEAHASAPEQASNGQEQVEVKEKVKRERKPAFDRDLIISVWVPNAKTRGANVRFNKYKTGMKVGEYIDLILAEHGYRTAKVQADLRWDSGHGWIAIGPEVQPVPENLEAAPNRVKKWRPQDDAVITVLKPDSRRGGAKNRFAEYVTGMTAKEYMDIIRSKYPDKDGKPRKDIAIYSDMRYDKEKNLVEFDPA